MTDQTLKHAEENGFEFVKKNNPTWGYKGYFRKENVEIFVESYSQCDGWYHRSDFEIMKDIDNFDALKREANEAEEYRKEIDRRMGYVG